MLRTRRAQARDADAIAKMVALASREDGLSEPALDAEMLRAHAFSAQPMLECWVAEDANGRLVGAAVTYRGYDIQIASPTLVVAALYVAPEGRGEGVARCLIAQISERAMELGAREISITTGIDNGVAHKFFASIGAFEANRTVYTLQRDQIEWLSEERA
jgi:N-acetylglutamate synthase-like GNAT family acetyltransferase